MTVRKLKEFIFENCYRRIGFTKANSYYVIRNQKIKKDLLLLANKLVKIRHFGQNSQKANENRKFSIVGAK